MDIWTEKEEAERLKARFDALDIARAAFARKHKVPGGDAMIYQHITGRRPISMEAAIAYAKGFGVPLDEISPRLAKAAAAGLDIHGVDVQQGGQRTEDGLVLPRFDTGGSMGRGLDLPDQPGVIESVRVSHEWMQKNVRNFTAVSNLRIVTGFGDSMRPLFNPGDPLIVDCGVLTVDFDSIYFFRVGGEGFIKRLQRVPSADGLTLQVISDNTRYPPWPITSDMDFEVFGRVLKVWRSEDF